MKETTGTVEYVSPVLWDFDGTLASSSEDVWSSLVFAAGKSCGVFSSEFLSDPVNLSLPMDSICAAAGLQQDDKSVKQFTQDVQVHYRQFNNFAQTILFPGIEELLEILKNSGRKSVIVTAKPLQALERLLEQKGWEKLFDGWISPDSVPGKKMTKTEMIALALDVYEGTPKDCWYIGDTWTDAVASRSNSVPFVAVTYGEGSTDKLLQQRPEYVAANVEELTTILVRELRRFS